VFVEVAARLAARTAAHFVHVGADLFGEHHRYARCLESLARRRRLDGRLHWLGYRPDALVLLAALNVYLHPADAEPLGRSLLEAMAVGVPCVAAAAGGPAEIISPAQTGLLFPPGDAGQAAAAVERLLVDSAFAQRLAAAARAQVQARFSASRMAAQLMGVYNELASQP
jgi:glycosyltransferase involved in cell wall biosynthesis